MAKRFISIWFRHLTTDWYSRLRPVLRELPFVLAAPDHGRLVIRSANPVAQGHGIDVGMAVADARALVPSLEVLDDKPELAGKLLKGLGEWCIRYTPSAAIDLPDGLILDVSGCANLWGGERNYFKEILTRIRGFGYDARAGIADTIGSAWGVARYGQATPLIEPGTQGEALIGLPPSALRLELDVLAHLQKLGLYRIGQFIAMPRSALRRRFGVGLLLRLDQALGREDESIEPLVPVVPHQERLTCLEPIVTATGIEIALRRLLETLCHRLGQEGKGIRMAVLTCYRVDERLQRIGIGTNRASRDVDHLFKLFENNIQTIEPDLGIELFVLEAPKVEEVSPIQESLWGGTGGLEDIGVAQLLDRLEGKLGTGIIHRYLPAEHHLPERSFAPASSVEDKPAIGWPDGRPRPIQLLPRPEAVEVTAPVPDYPPMLFRYKGKLHKIKRADGPERIEQEWWLRGGPHRDYYVVEDEEGRRYWIFRSGHYTGEGPARWFIHGFFA
jgi:protein ImuB